MAGTVLDSLVVELGLDPSKFSRGAQESLSVLRKMEQEGQRTGEQIESKARRSEDALFALKREFLGFFGLAFGGAEARRFVDFVTTLDASTGRLSKTLGVNTQELSEWQGAFQQVGGTAESANGAIGGLNAEMVKFQLTGQSAMLPVLSRLGISLFDANHHLRSATDLMLQLADAVQGMDARTATGFLSMIPGLNQDAINLILQGRAALEAHLAAARAAGSTTAESARIAQEYNMQLALLSRTATDAGRSLFTVFAPGMIEATKETTTFIGTARNLINELKGGEWHEAMQSSWELAKEIYSRASWLNPAAVVHKGAQYLFGADESGTPTSNEMTAARAALAAGMRGGSGLTPNWSNFLSGLSYLETTQQNTPASPGHSASGYFQFQPATAGRASGAGISDPRSGSYAQQAGAAAAYIRRFHPAAAAAIDRGDYAAAIAELRGEWPSLPGGSQPQSAARYATFSQELKGGGPRPPGGTTINVGGVVVNTSASDGQGIARDVDVALRRSLTAGAANYGPQ